MGPSVSSELCQISPLYSIDVQRMLFWDIAIIIRYPEWFQSSNRYSGNVQMSICVRFSERNGNVLKYHMEEICYSIIPLLHNENELF